MEDTIEISNRYYTIVTEKTAPGQVDSTIMVDTPKGKSTLGRIAQVVTESDEGEPLTLQTLHKKILSTFLRLIHAHRNDTEAQIMSLIAEAFPMPQASASTEENGEEEAWHTLCRQHLPSGISAAYKQEGERLLQYRHPTHSARHDAQCIVSIQKFFAQVWDEIVARVGSASITTLTTESHHCFVVHVDPQTTLFVMAPLGSLGIYMKHIERLRDVVQKYPR